MTRRSSLNAPARRVRARVRTPFVAIDGESVTDERPDAHRYVLLRTSDPAACIVNADGLSTVECLNFLLRQSAFGSKRIFVAFGLGYDVNMILRDVPKETLRELWREGSVTWDSGKYDYLLEWIPSKIFSVTASTGDFRSSIKIYDVFGFFQSSFVRALETWDIGSDEFLKGMKDHRSDFTFDELETIDKYCLHECELLVELMDALRDALSDVGLQLRSWLGAGAIASALMKKNHVEKAMTPVGIHRSPNIDDVILTGYYGGRTELFQQGEFARHVTARDINSAYPYQAIQLPSMVGQWRRMRQYDPSLSWAIWRVDWRMDDDVILAPFPYRRKRAITYPLSGSGYYHACEVNAALSLYPDSLRIGSGYSFEPNNPEEKPFAFIRDVYAQRKALKAQGHAGEKVLKLGINSVYGKLAQGSSRDGRIPPFQDYFWAGRITAGTRAMVLEAAAQRADELIGIATDGIMFAGLGPPIPDSSDLGGWERKSLTDFFIAQPGMYEATQEDGNRLQHSRGFFTREIDWPALRGEWSSNGPYGIVARPSTRFVGLGSALMRKDFGIWRTWHESERVLRLYSSRKFYDDADDGMSVRRLYPPSESGSGLSDRYIPKYAPQELSEQSAEFIQGSEQPLRG